MAQVDAIRTRDSKGQDTIASFAPVAGASWGLVIEEGRATLTNGSQDDQRLFLFLLVMGVALSILVVFLRLRRITRSFQESHTHLEQRVADRSKELATLRVIAATVSQSLDLNEILNHALDKTLQILEIEAGGIYLLDKEAGILTVAAQRGFSHQFVTQIDHLKVGEGLSGRVAQSGEPLVVRDISADPRLTRMVVREEGLHSLAIVPLSSKGKALGTLFASTYGFREFTDQDIQLLTSIGHQIGVAVENARFFAAEQRRAEQFRVISEVGRRITSILDIDEVLVQIARLVRETFDYYAVGIALVEGDEVVFRAGAGAFWDDTQLHQTLRLKVGQEGFTGWVAETGEPLLVPDVSQDPRYYSVPQASETRSELVVPLKIKGTVTGVLGVQSDRLNAFDESDLVMLRSLADQATVAIENARFFKAEQRRVEQLRVIGKVGRRITSILDIDEVLVQIVRLVQQAFDYYHVAIALIEGEEAVYRVGAGDLWDDPQFQLRPARLKVGREGIAGWVAATGEPLLVPDVGQEPRYVWMKGSKTRAELAVPIKAKGKVVGVLDAQSDRLNGFDETDLVMLQSLANQAAIAIENALLYEQAQQLAVLEERNRLARDLHDAVTQTLFSASLIAEALPAIWEDDQKEGKQLLSELRQLNRGALAEMRTLLLELRPATLVEANLGDLLRQLAEAVTGRSGLPATVTVEGYCGLASDVHVALYRIAQEALNNVLKHADASEVTVALRCTSFSSDANGEQRERVELCVSDDGQGFDPSHIPPDRLGLGIIRERAQAIGARFRVETKPGEGTRIVVVWECGVEDGGEG